jgi:hypothetical protein
MAFTEIWRKKTKSRRYLFTIAILTLVLIIALAGCSQSDNPAAGAADNAETEATSPSEPDAPRTSSEGNGISEGDDLIIPTSDISEKATFYPAEIDGIKLEVLAVKAPDGSIRTAFNTCQICYDSGRGYYKQDGNVLVCQNCGNRFKTDQVEVVSGGCNPVPIFPENKTVDDTNITISYGFLSAAKDIFANWKTEY